MVCRDKRKNAVFLHYFGSSHIAKPCRQAGQLYLEFIPGKKKAEGGYGWRKRGVARLPEWCSPVIFYHY